MAKKAIILIIVLVVVGMAGTVGGLIYFLNRPAEAEVVEEVDEGIDYETAKLLTIADMKVRLKQSGIKPSYLLATIDITLVDEEALTKFEALQAIIKDAILGVLETKTAEELDGNRAALKEPILQAIKDIFPKQEDKDKILGIAISQFLIQ